MDDEDAMMAQLLGLRTSKKCTTSWLAASLDDTLRRLFHLSSIAHHQVVYARQIRQSQNEVQTRNV